MATVNKVIIVGNLGQDPEVRQFDNGNKMATINVATSERWTDKQTGEQREHTEWHRIIFNNRLAEIVGQYMRKGSSIYVEGSLRTRKWTDQQGIERYTTEIRADSMQMLGGGQSQNQGHANQGGYAQPQGGYQQSPQQSYNQAPQVPNWQGQPPQQGQWHNQPMGQGQPQGYQGQPTPQRQAPQAQYYQKINGHPTNIPVGQAPNPMTPVQGVADDMPF